MQNYLMSYSDAGSGIPILFIHGYPLSRKLWEPQINDLQDVARVITPDLRGHGTSQDQNGPYSMDQMANDCAQLLQHLAIGGKVILCGLSMGGYVSFSFYRQYKNQVAGLILTATRAEADSALAKQNRENAIHTAETEGTEQIFTMMLPKLLSPKNFQDSLALNEKAMKIMHSAVTKDIVVKDQVALMNRANSTSMLPQIDIPVLIIHGVDDQIVPIQEAQTMHAAIKGSTLVILPKAGHLLNLEQPVLFNSSIRNFIKNIRRT